ncbi:MAG: CotH kinase family protein [Bacteroidetes bacterium]|nr:CotH kinase family protein [Bacteroidota bacterium]
MIKMKNIFILSVLLLAGLKQHAQSFYDLNTVQTIQIVFTQSNWDQLLDAEAAGAGNYIMAQSITINGTLFDSVGVKYKGNSTYNPNQVKNPFHIELDTYKSQDYQGFKDIKLSNVAKDPSFLREVLSYQILGQYMDAPRSNYANVYVNGTLIGLYSNSESITKTFADNHFYSNDNAFFKCNPPAGAGPGSTNLPNLVYQGTDSSLYYTAYELKSAGGWGELIDLCDTLKNTTASIERILDVDRALWMIAFDNALVNLDSYIGGFAQNYYLYRDDYRRFIPVVWDLNESFGRFSSTGTGNLTTTLAKQQMTPLLHENDVLFPLIQELLAVPMYKRMYLAHFKTILEENFANGSYAATGQSLQTLIDAHVQADNNKFFTYANFTANLNTDVTGGGPNGTTPGITNLMNGRNSYLLGLSEFTQIQPTISNVAPSNATPLQNDPVTITATVTDESTVYLGYRTALGAPFQRLTMYDDGAHNDGAANDDVYGLQVTMTTTFMQYYIYAENSNAGKFSPVRAEHEFYELVTTAPAASDLVLNELMASNSTTQADSSGEFDDWIELYNNSSSAISLDGYYLSDNANNLLKWEFPANSTINASDFYMVWADEDSSQGANHANFKLSAAGETLYLVNASGVVVDQVTFMNQATDTSHGRYVNGTGPFQTMPPTFDAVNHLFGGLAVADADAIGLQAYPNPVHDRLHLALATASRKPMEVYIIDMSGRTTYQGSIQDHLVVETANWPSGMYVVRVGESLLRVVVQ